MMNKVKVLIEGYAHQGKNGNYFASPTCTLIYAGDKKILVDPGANQKLLLAKLKEEKLTPEDIDAVFLSHYHPDHFLAIRLFPKTDIYDGTMIWREDKEVEHGGKILDTNIQIIPTPGHSGEHASLLIETNEGKVCIAQDVFWWEDEKQDNSSVEALMNLHDPFANDVDALKKSSRKVLEVADWIIPGHGKMFKSPQKML